MVNAASNGVAISLTIFLLAVSGFLYVFPIIMAMARQRFAESDLLNLFARRACWLIATLLMVVTSQIINILLNLGDLNLGGALVLYIYLFNLAGYLFLFYIVIKTLFDTISLIYNKKLERRGY